MAIDGTIRRRDGRPLGSPDHVKSQINLAFPGTQFVLVRRNDLMRPTGFNLTSLLFLLIEPRYPYWGRQLSERQVRRSFQAECGADRQNGRRHPVRKGINTCGRSLRPPVRTDGLGGQLLDRADRPQVKVARLLCNLAGLAVGNEAAVDLGDGRDAAQGAGHDDEAGNVWRCADDSSRQLPPSSSRAKPPNGRHSRGTSSCRQSLKKGPSTTPRFARLRSG